MKSYLIQQRIQPLVNQYAIYEADETGNAGAMIGFAQQKRFSFKEKFTVYSGEDKQVVAFEVQARRVIDLGATYDVTDGQGNQLGVLGKNFKSSLLRSTWNIFRSGQEDKPALIAQERNAQLAILRRVWELLPILSDIPFFVKYHFDFTDPLSGQVVANYEKTTTLRDHYRLTIHETAGFEALDPRLLISLGVMMDALQSR